MSDDSMHGFGPAKRSILVVEDNEINRDLLCALLVDDFEVITAENGLVGLEKLREHQEILSLVLLDVYMPQCDGFEFLRRRAEDEALANVPVIVTTASDSLDDEIRCLQLGANDFVVKPYNADIIMNRINNTIHLRETASIVNQLTWDDLTKLFNKEFFYRHSEDALTSAPDKRFDMICSNIENFKHYNDRYGRATCNDLLRDLASNLKQTLPGIVAGGRIGGDKFAFLVSHRGRGWEQILEEATKDLAIPGIRVKFGIVEDVSHSLAVSLACDRALIALDKIKGRRGTNVAWYNDELHQQQIVEEIILETMEQALKDRQFVVYYQPKHDLRTDRTGGVEALARWIHPELGFVSPAQFIPVLERQGYITQLDMYILDEACRELKHLEELGLRPVPVSVNASAYDFDVPDLVQHITRTVDGYGIDHSLLHVELTETAYSEDPETVARALKDLRDLGFCVELDDFGAGYSSLASLNVLPLDVMKLDMSIIRQATALNDFRIVHAAIQLAQLLGLSTVAEGVESQEEVEQLKSMGCDYIQGYYFSKPLRSNEFEAYLAEH